MSQIVYRGNLSSKTFPFLSQRWGRTIIVPQYDNTFNRQVTSQEDSDRDIGIPQMYYGHNVMATAQGFQSVGFETLVPPLPTGAGSVYDISGTTNERLLLGVTTSGYYIYEFGHWVFKDNLHKFTGAITIATAQGKTYICSAGTNIYQYDTTVRALNTITLSGLNVANIAGICAVAGYLIVWTLYNAGQFFIGNSTVGSPIITGITNTATLAVNGPISGSGVPANTTILSIDSPSQITLSANITVGLPGTGFVQPEIQSQVLWSSTIDPTDFVPSLTTGAGGGAIEAAKGGIATCIAHSLGIFVFTTGNIVVGLYSGNARYPFNFREIVNSGGITDSSRITYDANSGNLYTYTSSGIQLISTSQAQTILPEATDFLAGNLFEDFDETTNTFSVTDIGGNMIVRMNIIADRYLVISYGATTTTHALIYDLVFKRWGKLKITHVGTLEDFTQTLVPTNAPKKSLCFILSTGEIKRAVFDTGNTSAIGVILFGKYQFVRPRMLTLDEVFLENFPSGTTPFVQILTSLDGKNTVASTPALLDNNTLYRHYGALATGINHSILIKGAFDMVSIVLAFHIHGKR